MTTRKLKPTVPLYNQIIFSRMEPTFFFLFSYENCHPRGSFVMNIECVDNLLGEAEGRLMFQDPCRGSSLEYPGVCYRDLNLESHGEAFPPTTGSSSTLLSAATSWFPVLHSILPRDPGESTLLSKREGITALAVHPHLMWVAVAFATRSKTHVTVHDIVAGTSVELTHGFMTDAISAMIWKPQSHGTLLVGIKEGVMVWGVSEWNNCRCIVYPCRQMVSALTLGGDDFCILAAGGDGVLIEMHDISKAPSESALFVRTSLEGPTSSLVLSTNAMLLQGFRHYCAIKVWDIASGRDGASTSTTSPTTFSTDQPVLHISQIGATIDLFAVSFDRTEGIVLFYLKDKNHLIVMSKVSTSADHIGGCVRSFSISSRRLFLVTESSKVLVFHIEVNRAAFVAHYIGCFGVSEGAIIHASDGCFPKGTLLVVGGNAVVHFIPCYHTKALD